jgi:hypothetical protein
MTLFPVKHKVDIKLTNQSDFIKGLKLRTAKDIYATNNNHFFIGSVKFDRFIIKFRKTKTRNNYFYIKGTITNSNVLIQTIVPTFTIVILGVWLVTLSIFFFYIDKAWFIVPSMLIITTFWYIINIILALIFKTKAIHIIESIVRIAKESNTPNI